MKCYWEEKKKNHYAYNIINRKELRLISKACIKTSKSYSRNNIGAKWVYLLRRIQLKQIPNKKKKHIYPNTDYFSQGWANTLTYMVQGIVILFKSAGFKVVELREL